jgi:hypothetical protein
MTTVTSWVGKSRTIQILANQDLPLSYIRSDLLIPNAQITWDPPSGPPGVGSYVIQSSIPKGYIVSYDVEYQLTGYMYTDPDKNTYFNLTTYYNRINQPPAPIYTSIPQNVPKYWRYGPNSDNPGVKVSGLGGAPSSLSYVTTTTNVCQCGAIGNFCCHTPTGITLNIIVTINVANNCGSNNLSEPICREICSSNPGPCKVGYDEHCLNNKFPDRIADPVCLSFYGNWIKNNASDTFIDTQAKLYCRQYYKGFGDLDPKGNNTNRTVAQRQYDLQICGCNLTAPGEDLDPGIKLYQNYFDNLVAQHPGYSSYGEQVRCTYNYCASTLLCNVPQCIIDPSVDNSGNINGGVNITISAECNKILNGDTDTSILNIILIVVLILVIIIIFVYFIYSPLKPRKATVKPPLPKHG